MKARNIIWIILIAVISMATSVTTSTVLSKPAVPSDVVVFSAYGGTDQIRKEILPYCKKGYILKSMIENYQGSHFTIVMEKY